MYVAAKAIVPNNPMIVVIKQIIPFQFNVKDIPDSESLS
jgi:hypothetical protein